MELKTYTPVSPKFIFEKIKFKVLHYIQHDFICQRPGLSKYQTSLFSLLINYFEGDKYFFFKKSRCVNVLLKLIYL